MVGDLTTVTGLLLRGLLGGRRPWALALMGLLPVAVALAGAFGDIQERLFWARLLQHLVLPIVVPFVAVILGAGALSASRDDGTILYLASTPVARVTLVVAHILAAWLAATAILAPGIIVAHAILLGPGLGSELLWPLVGAVLAAVGYCAAAVWVALLLRHPVVVCVLYILIWEGTLSGWSDTADRYSLAAYARRIASNGLIDTDVPDLSMTLATVVPLAVLAVAVVGGARSLQRRELP